MDKFDRIVQLHSVLRTRRTAVSFEDLRAKLECSKATLHRAIGVLRDQLHAPLVFDKSANGYRYEETGRDRRFELPGLWFSAGELQALAVLQRLLSDLGGGLLEEHLSPLSKRLEDLTKHRRLNLGEAGKRLRFPAIAGRPPGAAFQAVAAATLQRQQLRFQYHSRGSDEHTERVVSPQRVTHYRDSWYLDAWDEGKGDHRTFSMDRIRNGQVLEKVARDIPEAELDAHYASSYGIFSGQADQVAVLRFSAERARWVADEQWHPQQAGSWLADGCYELRIPFHDPRELTMEILRHGPHAEVVKPESLRDEVRTQLAQALKRYPASD
jgi:predicted DNA-binding transcriptional regulator YafY